MVQGADARMRSLVEQLRQDPGLVGQLPSAEGAIVQAALNGQSVHAIAHDRGISEQAVWTALSGAARLASGRAPTQPVETGGLGADTDPGITGGYDELDYGEAGVDPPPPIPTEAPPGRPTPVGDERPQGGADR